MANDDMHTPIPQYLFTTFKYYIIIVIIHRIRAVSCYE